MTNNYLKLTVVTTGGVLDIDEIHPRPNVVAGHASSRASDPSGELRRQFTWFFPFDCYSQADGRKALAASDEVSRQCSKVIGKKLKVTTLSIFQPTTAMPFLPAING